MGKSKDLRLIGKVITFMVIWPISARVEQCGATLRGEGVLQSHGFPRGYPNNYNCDWNFEAGPEDTVELTFTTFDVEDSQGCRYDYLQVQAEGRSPKYCGQGVRKVAPGGVLRAKGPVRLVFKSDTSDTMQGFRLTYKISPPEPEDDGEISCAAGSCKNGADCVDVAPGEVACFCLDGFEGDFCEIDIDECASNPCLNGGTCVDEVNSFSCDCPEGFLGETCGVDVDDCIADPCRNGGTCIDGPNSFECECVTGYTGWNCGQDIDECESGPCQNMGVCEDRIGFYECVCFPGYTGVNCEIPPPTTPAADPEPQAATPAPPQSQDEPNQPQENPSTRPTEPNIEDPPERPPDLPAHDTMKPEPADGGVQPARDSPTEDSPQQQSDPPPSDKSAKKDSDPVDEAGDRPPTATDGDDRTYPNSTIGASRNDDGGPDAGRQQDEPEGSKSNTGLIVGIIAGLMGVVAAISIAIRLWVTKNQTKIEPVAESTQPTDLTNENVGNDREKPNIEEQGKEEQNIDGQNGTEDVNDLELIDEDFPGRKKSLFDGPMYGRATAEFYPKSNDKNAEVKNVGRKINKHEKSRKKRSLADRIKSFSWGKAKKSDSAVTDNKKNATNSSIKGKQPPTNAVHDYIGTLNQLDANLQRMRENSFAPYAQPIRNRRTSTTRNLMSALARQRYNQPAGYPRPRLMLLENPFNGQQYQSTDSLAGQRQCTPFLTNPFSVSIPRQSGGLNSFPPSPTRRNFSSVPAGPSWGIPPSSPTAMHFFPPVYAHPSQSTTAVGQISPPVSAAGQVFFPSVSTQVHFSSPSSVSTLFSPLSLSPVRSTQPETATLRFFPPASTSRRLSPPPSDHAQTFTTASAQMQFSTPNWTDMQFSSPVSGEIHSTEHPSVTNQSPALALDGHHFSQPEQPVIVSSPSPPAVDAFPSPLSPTTLEFSAAPLTNNDAVISEEIIEPELLKIPRKSKKKSKKHKKSKKRIELVDDAYNTIPYEQAFIKPDAVPSPYASVYNGTETPHTVLNQTETLADLNVPANRSSRDMRLPSIPAPTNRAGVSAEIPFHFGTAAAPQNHGSRRPVDGNISHNNASSADPFDLAEMENLAESIFFSRMPNNPIQSSNSLLRSGTSPPFSVTGSPELGTRVSTRTSIPEEFQNQFTNRCHRSDDQISSVSLNREFFGAQNSDSINYGVTPSVNSQHNDVGLSPETQKLNITPGYIFFR